MMEPDGRDYYEAHKKSVGLAYLLWVIGFGANNFYAGNMIQAVLQLLLSVWVTIALIAIGEDITDAVILSTVSGPFFALVIWRIVDLFKIPGYIRKHNLRVLRRIGLRDLPYDW